MGSLCQKIKRSMGCHMVCFMLSLIRSSYVLPSPRTHFVSAFTSFYLSFASAIIYHIPYYIFLFTLTDVYRAWLQGCDTHFLLVNRWIKRLVGEETPDLLGKCSKNYQFGRKGPLGSVKGTTGCDINKYQNLRRS